MWVTQKGIDLVVKTVINEAEQAVTEMRQELEKERELRRDLAHRLLEAQSEPPPPPDLSNYDFCITTKMQPSPLYSQPRSLYSIQYQPVIKHPDTQTEIPGEHLAQVLTTFPLDNWKWVDGHAEMLFSHERLPTWPEVQDKLDILTAHLTKIINSAAHASKLVQILAPDTKGEPGS